MIFLITGNSHTGKTMLAQKLLEKYHYPYLSIDHLKMGLIRSGHTALTPCSPDEALTEYLWPIVREMIKTAVENYQNLIVEGCYIPLDFKKDFADDYQKEIQMICLVMSESYIKNHFDEILKHANAIESRLADDFTLEDALEGNRFYRQEAKRNGIKVHTIDERYDVFDQF